MFRIRRLLVSVYRKKASFTFFSDVPGTSFCAEDAVERFCIASISTFFRYLYENDLVYLRYKNFVLDMDLVYAPKDVNERPAVIPERYNLVRPSDCAPISPTEIALAQEAFRKIAEKVNPACSHSDWL